MLRILSKSGLQIQTLSASYPTVQHHIPHLLKTLANLKPLLFRPNGDRNHRSKHRMMVMILVGAEHGLTTDKGHGIRLTWLGQPEQLFVEIEQKSPHIQRIDVAEHVAILTPLIQASWIPFCCYPRNSALCGVPCHHVTHRHWARGKVKHIHHVDAILILKTSAGLLPKCSSLGLSVKPTRFRQAILHLPQEITPVSSIPL